MSNQLVLSPADLQQLAFELTREDLQIYTVVRMARNDLAAGAVDSAVARLRVDADKLRAYDTWLNELLARRDEPPVREPGWALTTEGRQCHCNYCHKQFLSRAEFSRHFQQCPVRVKAGFVEPTIYAA